jgi:hypothetical protein
MMDAPVLGANPVCTEFAWLKTGITADRRQVIRKLNHPSFCEIFAN